MTETATVSAPPPSDPPAAQEAPGTSLLGLIGSTVVGWAAPVAGQRAVVELFIDGKIVDSDEASRPAPTSQEMAQLAPLGPMPAATSAASDWFALKTPQEFRIGRELLLEVRCGGQSVGQGRKRLFGGLKGKFVGVHDGVVQGFVANPFGDDAPPPLELRLDGQSLGQIATEPPAPDGRRRFNIKLPPDLRDGEMHDVEVFWADSDAPLPGSPQRWQAPAPKAYQAIKAREADKAQRKSRPPYVLPAAELAAVSTLLKGQALRRGAPAAVAENAATIWGALERPQPAAGPRLCIILTASTFSDLESSFGLGQLLDLHPGATVRVMLPSAEAVKFAADDQRDSARDGLAPTLASGAFAALASRLPPDDLVAFIPAHAILSATFLDQVRATLDEASDGAVALCAQAMATPDSFLLATPTPPSWASSRDCVGVFRAAHLATRARSRRFDFEGVRFDEVELQVGQSEPGGAVLQIASPMRTPAAETLIVVTREAPAPDPAALGRLAGLAETHILVGGGDGPASAGWMVVDPPQGFGADAAALAAGLAGPTGDTIVLEGSAWAAGAPIADLPAVRTLAIGPGAHAIQRLDGSPGLTSVAQLEQALEAALTAPSAGVYIPASRNPDGI